MVKRILLPLLLILGVLGFAENSLTAELTSLAGVARGEDGAAAAGNTEAQLTIRSEGNRNAKGELTLDADVSETALVDISRAYVKVRFPEFRITLGKTRLSWGEGFLFNAGDVLFGSQSTGVDLTADELRTAGKWLASVYYPLGRFSFAEAVYLPPQINLLDYRIDSRLYAAGALSEPPSPGADQNPSGGGRIVLRPGGIKVEGGYLFAGDTDTHKPYVSLQGNLIFDWHFSAASALSAVDPRPEEWYEELALSFGLSHLLRVGYEGSMNLRLEGLIRPDKAWEESADEEEFALYLYPELSYTPDDRRSFFYRAIVSPVDLSAAHILGASWNIYQGFELLAYGGFNSGESGDTFAWNDESQDVGGGEALYPGYFLSLGCGFSF